MTLTSGGCPEEEEERGEDERGKCDDHFTVGDFKESIGESEEAEESEYITSEDDHEPSLLDEGLSNMGYF